MPACWMWCLCLKSRRGNKGGNCSSLLLCVFPSCLWLVLYIHSLYLYSHAGMMSMGLSTSCFRQETYVCLGRNRPDSESVDEATQQPHLNDTCEKCVWGALCERFDLLTWTLEWKTGGNTTQQRCTTSSVQHLTDALSGTHPTPAS